jgi:RNA polymerase sigma-70 factor (ECF subfamily)
MPPHTTPGRPGDIAKSRCVPFRSRRRSADVTAVEPWRIDGMDAVIEWGVPLVDWRGMKGNASSLSGLMERYADGDDGVFEAVYASLCTPLYRFCLRLTAQRAEADDLFQETFLKMHRARATFAPGSNPLHWSYAIARSLYLSGRRYWRRRPEKLGASEDIAERDDIHVDAAKTPESEAIADHLLDVVSLELDRMSEKNRSAYVLLKEEGMSAKDAAVLLGTTANTVKQRAHRAYIQLKAALGDAGWKEYDPSSC